MAEAPRRAPRRREEALDLDFGDPNRVAGTVERVTSPSTARRPVSACSASTPRGAGARSPWSGPPRASVPASSWRRTGSGVNDRSYGLQFRAEHLRVVPPSTLEGIEKYLARNDPGHRPPLRGAARARVRGGGLRGHRERSGAAPRASRDRTEAQAQVVAAWAEQKAVREIMVFLQSHGVGSARAVRIYRLYGDRAVDRVRENPYRPRPRRPRHRLPHRRRDRAVHRIRPRFDPPGPGGAPPRAAGVRGRGHCAGERRRSSRPRPSFSRWMRRSSRGRSPASSPTTSSWTRRATATRGSTFPSCTAPSAARRTTSAACSPGGGPPWGDIDPEKALPWVEQRVGFELSDSQRAAVARTIASASSVITGGPGVGKTTIVNAVLTSCARRGFAPASARRPGGRRSGSRSPPASKRPRSTGSSSSTRPPEASGTESTTPSTPTSWSWTRCRWWTSCSRTSSSAPSRSTPRCSSWATWTSSRRSAPGPCSPEIIGSDRVPTARLTEIFRQGESSRIVVNRAPDQPGRIARSIRRRRAGPRVPAPGRLRLRRGDAGERRPERLLRHPRPRRRGGRATGCCRW